MKKISILILGVVLLLLGSAQLLKSTPKISVIMPVYNTESYLVQSIKSVLKQSFKDFEFIIVNDASTDNSLKVINKYAAQDKRIRVFNMPKNSGAGAARNEGIRHIRGDYVLFVDSDDWMLSDMLEELYKQSVTYDLDMVLSDALVFDDSTQKLNFNWGWYPFLDVELLQRNNLEIFSYRDLPDDFFQIATKYPWNKLIRASLIKKYDLQFTHHKKHNDSIFITKAMLRAKRIGYVPQKLYVYREKRAGALTNQYIEDWQSVYEVFSVIKEDIENIEAYNLLKESLNKWIASFNLSQDVADEDKSIIENIRNLMEP